MRVSTGALCPPRRQKAHKSAFTIFGGVAEYEPGLSRHLVVDANVKRGDCPRQTLGRCDPCKSSPPQVDSYQSTKFPSGAHFHLPAPRKHLFGKGALLQSYRKFCVQICIGCCSSVCMGKSDSFAIFKASARIGNWEESFVLIPTWFNRTFTANSITEATQQRETDCSTTALVKIRTEFQWNSPLACTPPAVSDCRTSLTVPLASDRIGVPSGHSKSSAWCVPGKKWVKLPPTPCGRANEQIPQRACAKAM